LANKWETFSKENAEYYILTSKNIDYATPEGQAFFYRSGEELTQRTFSRVSGYLTSRDLAIEIGSGIGRLVFPHAKIFNEVYAVDISETMLNRLTQGAAERNITNITTFLSTDRWDIESKADYIYSSLVFQHMEDIHEIGQYIRRISITLKPEGIAQLQFDTRPQTALYRLRNHLPDSILPKSYRKGIRRIRRNASKLRNLFKNFGLNIIEELGENTELHYFILQKR
jgi:cyclopropane fatty-acyl-phospholipid synthase-like methyltransferase